MLNPHARVRVFFHPTILEKSNIQVRSGRDTVILRFAPYVFYARFARLFGVASRHLISASQILRMLRHVSRYANMAPHSYPSLMLRRYRASPPLRASRFAWLVSAFASLTCFASLSVWYPRAASLRSHSRTRVRSEVVKQLNESGAPMDISNNVRNVPTLLNVYRQSTE